MTKNVATTAKLILDTCETSRICCQICESYSTEAGLPHFRDLIHGVWSSATAAMNPFKSADDSLSVRLWFEWRLALMARGVDLTSYRTVTWLQKRLSMLMATECVDALADQAGLEGVLYLNGRVEKARCFDCGWNHGSGEPGTRDHLCPRCAGELWPDVAMFGRNAQEAARGSWSQHLMDSHVHVFIGIPAAPPETSGKARVLTIDAEGVHVTTRTNSLTLRTEALERYLNAGFAKAGVAGRRSAELDGIAASTRTHRSLLALCRLIDAGSAL